MSSRFFVDVSEKVFTGVSLNFQPSSYFDRVSYSNKNIVLGSMLSSSDGGHVYNGKNNPFSYDVSRIRVRGEVHTMGIQETWYNCFYVIIFKTTINSERKPNLSLLTPASRISDFFLYEQPSCVLCFKIYRIGDSDPLGHQSVHFDVSYNKHVVVRPDEVVGVHYAWFTYTIEQFVPPSPIVDASAEVSFKLV